MYLKKMLSSEMSRWLRWKNGTWRNENLIPCVSLEKMQVDGVGGKGFAKIVLTNRCDSWRQEHGVCFVAAPMCLEEEYAASGYPAP